MQQRYIRQLFKDTDYVRTGGSPEELKCAEYLLEQCKLMGVEGHIESFPVQMANMKEAHLYADGKEIPCKGYLNCGSGEVEAPLVYLPSTDPASLTGIRGKVVLLDTGVGYFGLRDLLENGAVGFITYNGNVNFRDKDIDNKELRSYVHRGEKLLGVNIHVTDAISLVKNKVKTVRLVVDQEEYEGESRNAVVELPGETDEWIVMTAHYDSVPLSRGAYDNMSGSVGLLGVLEALKDKKHRYGVRFVFCGSEERGLLGSKAYVEAHEEELSKIALNINLDMIGTIMGKFIACVSAEEKLVHFITYFAQMRGWGIIARQGVYSSDSTPFADKGVPSLSFARLASGTIAPIHNRYDTMEVLSMERMQEDIAFIAAFTGAMADAVKCPVGREIPEKVKGELDEYMSRKRRNA